MSADDSRTAADPRPCVAGRLPELMEAPADAPSDYFWFRCDCGVETDSFGYVDEAEEAWESARSSCRGHS